MVSIGMFYTTQVFKYLIKPVLTSSSLSIMDPRALV